MTPDEARKGCSVCKGNPYGLCRLHEGYRMGYEAAQREQHARTIRGMNVNATASPPGMPRHFASEEPQGRPGRS